MNWKLNMSYQQEEFLGEFFSAPWGSCCCCCCCLCSLIHQQHFSTPRASGATFAFLRRVMKCLNNNFKLIKANIGTPVNSSFRASRASRHQLINHVSCCYKSSSSSFTFLMSIAVKWWKSLETIRNYNAMISIVALCVYATVENFVLKTLTKHACLLKNGNFLELALYN